MIFEGMLVREDAPSELKSVLPIECVNLVGVSFGEEIVQTAGVHNTLWKTHVVRNRAWKRVF